MAAELFYLPFRPAFDANGIVVAGATLAFYATGTSTPQTVYSDSGLSIPLTNPVTANAAGVWPAIYLNDALTYRVVLRDDEGVILKEQDPYIPLADDATSADAVAAKEAAEAAAAQAEAAQTAAEAAASEATGSIAPSRDLFNSLASRAGLLPEHAVIECRRTDFLEYSVYIPTTADLSEWARYNYSNRFNLGYAGGGAPCLLNVSLAYLYSSTSISLPTGNQSTGTQTQSATETQTPSAASDTGTWTAPATVGGITTISYPSPQNAGATRIYTIDNSGGTKGRVFLRGYNNSGNGGIGKVVVKLDGVEIAADKYLAPLVGSERIVNYRANQSTTAVLSHIPIADGIGTGSITVELSESTTNPASARLYDGGVLCFNGVTYNTAGLHGLAEYQGSAYNLMSHSGTRVVYQVADATRILWKYRTQTVAGIANFTVYDNSGVEIATYENESIDTYSSAGATDRAVEVAKGLPKATYWLHVWTASTKNASATRYAIYDRGVTASDETDVGVPGVDAFDVLDTPSNPANSLDYGTHILFGPGNMEFAFQAHLASQAIASASVPFVSGVAHGFETTPTLAVYVDGADQTTAYNALTAGQMLAGETVRVAFTTNIKSPTTTQLTAPTSSGVLTALTTMCTLTYDWTWSAAGGLFKGSQGAWTANVVEYRNYGRMLQVQSRKPGSKGVGGGFDALAFDTEANYALTTYDDAQGVITRTANQIAFANDEYVVSVKTLNAPEIASTLPPDGGTQYGNYNSYASGYNKGYSDIRPGITTGRAAASGTGAYTKQLLFRVFKGASMRQAIGL